MYSMIPVFIPISFRFGWGWLGSSTAQDAVKGPACRVREGSCYRYSTVTGPQIRVRNWKLFFLLLNKNICCGCSKEPSQWDGSFEHPRHMFKLMDREIIAILHWKTLLNWPYAVTHMDPEVGTGLGMDSPCRKFLDLCMLVVIWWYKYEPNIYFIFVSCWMNFI